MPPPPHLDPLRHARLLVRQPVGLVTQHADLVLQQPRPVQRRQRAGGEWAAAAAGGGGGATAAAGEIRRRPHAAQGPHLRWMSSVDIVLNSSGSSSPGCCPSPKISASIAAAILPRPAGGRAGAGELAGRAWLGGRSLGWRWAGLAGLQRDPTSDDHEGLAAGAIGPAEGRQCVSWGATLSRFTL